jgi:alpha-tubulin suppressor-like RCC1 family protein
VLALGAGLHHTCAVTSDGRLYCWGMNDQGQLGVSTAPMSHSLVPIAVDDATDWTAISIADDHVLALKAGGALYAWGTNTYGELGTGDTLGRRAPALVSEGWRVLAAGAEHSCAIRDTGALFCWGYGGRGQLGLGVLANYLDPQEVSPGSRWSSVAAFDHTCAIDDAGALHCWGRNDSGQTGSPATMSEVTRPTRVGTDSDWTAVAAGRSHTCGLRAGGALHCFGSNASGQLGRGAPSATLDPTPAPVSGDLAFAAISAGADHMLGRTDTNELYAWGDANEGALGIGPAADAVGAPARVGTTSDWRVFEGGASYSCGTRGGVLHCFGMNRQNPVGTGGGQLGLGDRVDRFEPSAVCLP